MSLEYPIYYMTEGTGGKPSSHKAESASHELGISVEVIGVKGPEPNWISTATDLVSEKWQVFADNCPSFESRVLLLALDVVTGKSVQGGRILDVRKQNNIRAGNGLSKREALAKKVAKDMTFAGGNNVVLTLEPAAQVGVVDPRNESVIMAASAARTSITLPNNPLRDEELFIDYVSWSRLEEKLYDSIPGGYDIATLLAFLALNDKLAGHRVEDLVLFPGNYYEQLCGDHKYVETQTEFFYEQGRIPEGMLDVLEPSLAVGLLKHAFNTPKYLLESVVGAVNNVNAGYGQTVRRNPINLRPRVPKWRLT